MQHFVAMRRNGRRAGAPHRGLEYPSGRLGRLAGIGAGRPATVRSSAFRRISERILRISVVS